MNLLGSEYLFWLVIALLYLVDNVKLLDEDELLLTQSFSRKWSAQFHAIPFVVNKRNLYVSNIFSPFSMIIRMNWMTECPRSPLKLRRARRELFVLKSRIFPYQLISIVTFCLLLVVGPLLTLRFGFLPAVLSVAWPYCYTLSVLLFLLLFDRRYFGLSWNKWASMVFELIICPGFVINITKRLSLSKTLSAFDGVAFCLSNASPFEADRLRELVSFRLSDYENHVDGGVDFLNRVQSYRNALG